METPSPKTNAQMTLWPGETEAKLFSQAARERLAAPAKRQVSMLARRVAKDVLCFWAPILPSVPLSKSRGRKSV